MIVRAIYVGNKEEAYVNDRFQEGLNVISSDDNNKGKTIVIQSIMYCLGNVPGFPASFPVDKYYYILHIEVDDRLVKICRKGKNYIVKNGEEYFVFDTTAEFKRYWNKNIGKLPIISVNNVNRIVDPELLVQVFFVGQDVKTTRDIVNKGLYRKEDFYNLLYAMAGIDAVKNTEDDADKIKRKIKDLQNEKSKLIKENKILKKNDYALEYLSATNDRIALKNTLKEVEKIKEKLLSLKKERNNAVSRKTKNEMALKELRSLNRTMKVGKITCQDCGSNHIAYESADADFSFDISTVAMRQQILDSIKEKIDIYTEEIERLTTEINKCQEEFEAYFTNEEVTLEALLIMTKELEGTKNADARINEIELELKQNKEMLEVKNAITEDSKKKQKKLLEEIVSKMNEFYKKVDMYTSDEYVDIFTGKGKTYSGSESTEFHMARMYAFQKVLKHDYPIVIDSFRAEDLSSERERRAIELFTEIPNQMIFTTTLKEEEENKYEKMRGVTNIDFSSHKTNHMLSKKYVDSFMDEAANMLITFDSFNEI